MLIVFKYNMPVKKYAKNLIKKSFYLSSVINRLNDLKNNIYLYPK